MKTFMDALLKAIDEMKFQAESEQESKVTNTLYKRATTGELGVEFQFYEQIHLKNRKSNLSVTIPPSRRASMQVTTISGDLSQHQQQLSLQ